MAEEDLEPKPRLLSIDSYDYRAICLFCACLLYAFAGSPTPSTFGIAECVIGILLALSIGIGRSADVLARPEEHRFWKSAGQFYLFYGLIITSLFGGLNGASAIGILRDIIPFLFLFLPVFLLPTIRAKPQYFRTTVFAILMIGMVFSLRSIVMRDPALCSVWCNDELLYLENMPTVLFAALFLIGCGIRFLMKGVTLRSVMLFTGLLLLALLPIAAMALTLQRASLGAVAAYSVLICGIYLVKQPTRAVAAFIVIAAALIVLGISFGEIFSSLDNKTSLVGLNMRPEEFAAVWDVVSSDWLSFFFGIGWGGQFNSPAVGGLSVNFTHNFFTSVLLKSGLCGLLLASLYILALLERLFRVILKDPVLGWALAAPIFIDLTLYASFKSLDFGLVLLLISSSLVYSRQSESFSVLTR